MNLVSDLGGEPIVASGWDDASPRPVEYAVAHREGIVHRAVHLEVYDGDGATLVWRRRDGRLELPGGHPNWVDGAPEPSDLAAARELLEETGATGQAVAAQLPSLRRHLEQVTRCLNQSRAGRNNEWVTVYRISAEHCPALALDGDGLSLSDEGNHDPRWMRLTELRRAVELDPMRCASSLKLLLARAIGC